MTTSRYAFGSEVSRTTDTVVLSAQDLRLPREAVVKVLSRVDDPRLVQRFFREARTLARLQHPGIQPVYGAGVGPDGLPYFAAGKTRGRRLADDLAARPGDGSDRYALLLVFERVCQTIAYVHEQGVSHGLLSAASVWVDEVGDIQVADWDRVADGVEPAEDVRALGEILATILAGDPTPEDLTSLVDRCRAAGAGGASVTARDAAAAVGAHLAAAKDRAHRLELEALESRVEADRAHTRADEARAAGTAQRRRRRQVVGLAAAALLAVLTGVLGVLWLEEGHQARDARARDAIEAAMREAERQGEGQGLAQAASAAARAARLASEDLPGTVLAARARTLAATLAERLRTEREAADAARREREQAWRADEARIRAAMAPFDAAPPPRADVERDAWDRAGDPWAHLEAARHALRAEPRDPLAAVRHLTVAVALRPESPALLALLAEGLDAQGDASEAAAVRERAKALAGAVRTSTPASPAGTGR